jgi:hypothetical protein
VNKNFCAFILTHGRPERVVTYKSLRKHGYTGKIFIIIDNEDDKEQEYRRIYGDEVIMFDKKSIAKTFDEGDNFGDRRTIIYARNACFQIAEALGFEYFIQLDDDYNRFSYRKDENREYIDKSIKNLDRFFASMLKYYKSIQALSIAMAQGGDYIGGSGSSTTRIGKPIRKCMNTFICSTKRPFQFVGRINEDVNTYTNLGGKGELFLTILDASIAQATTQSNSGGMTEVYLDSGTYVKSFYTVMYSPSCTTIRLMQTTHRRLHHQISWINAVPVILDEKYKKKTGKK